MAKQRQSLSKRTSMLGPNLQLQKSEKRKIDNIRVAYDERSPRTTYTPSGGAYVVTPSSTPTSTFSLITQAGDNITTQAGDNIITN
jgi:hypothetical protein